MPDVHRAARPAGPAPRPRRSRTSTDRRPRRGRRRARSSSQPRPSWPPTGTGSLPDQPHRPLPVRDGATALSAGTRSGAAIGPARGRGRGSAGECARPVRLGVRHRSSTPASDGSRTVPTASVTGCVLSSSSLRSVEIVRGSGPKLQIISCSPRRNRSQRPSSSKSIASTSPVSVLRCRISSAYRSSRSESRRPVSLDASKVAGSWGSGSSSPKAVKASNSRRRPSRVARAIRVVDVIGEEQKRGLLAVLLAHEEHRDEGGQQHAEGRQALRRCGQAVAEGPVADLVVVLGEHHELLRGRSPAGAPKRRSRKIEYWPSYTKGRRIGLGEVRDDGRSPRSSRRDPPQRGP